MKKLIKFIFIPLILLGVICYGIYIFGTNAASEKLIDGVSAELEQSGQMDNVKEYVESDPELQSFVEEAKTANPESLPFTTKEEATRVLIQKVGISKLTDIQTKVQDGTISKEEVLQTLEQDLSEEEMTALKVIAYKELYN